MPPTPTLIFDRGSYYGKTVHFRRGYVILKVHSQDDSLKEVMPVIRDVMGGIGFDARHNIVGRWAYLKVDDTTDILTLVKDLNHNPRVQYAEPDLSMEGSAEVREPGDPYLYSEEDFYQWGIKDINLLEAWKDQSGDKSALIGLVDSGVPITGEDDDGSLSIHDRLTDIIDHVDLDGSRFIAGYNHLFETPTVWPKDNSNYFHGSHMAGIIAARENNKDHEGNFIGTAGVNWGSDVYVSVVMDSGDKSTIALVYLAVAEILEYASGPGAPNVVINLSINYSDRDLEEVLEGPGQPGQPVVVDDSGVGTDTPSPDEPADTDPTDPPFDPMKSMNDMFGLIVEAGAIICISAGNGDLYDDGTLMEQPARLGVETVEYAPNILAVGSIASDWSIGEHSGRGIADMVFAPGEGVCTIHTRYGDQVWSQESGTSIANAHVSGLAALLWSENPSLIASEVVNHIKNNCQFPTVGTEYLSHGIVDANAALRAVKGLA